ncbi:MULTISPECIES: HTH-type transcriptional regulator UlaR [Providencia]|jgi:DeoR family ulaG and ulaABCDEF operon transcriptional repressor|uniref:HTH-type transcriptional regulator UlaR n=1 Tax=Providencia TaxID=586 RepID=UPI0003E21DB2|nr:MULTISPECIES: HTH-type transcriptional regulator UlaR [Providencia]MTC73152.1 HTH-type transcriptional regulator UlaR [Providencia sp. wls1919]ETT01292.1 transcriptional regulator, DeoR family [Providencia alcalifaciens PAL-3]EUC98954.1 transcriptional regulator, DeoR family [Providencia alcalifaciens PAL-1]MBG5883901.1 HTH-type transcriptional regulator UlaR [Providencia alcalifaciens]MBS0924790.1 HTH-type transcriptional regulator UlaR [Providencia sp. JGM181]
MNETQRHHEILSLLKENQIINVSFITKHFDISPATARRDIAKLDEQGKLKKIRNGAERIEEKRLRWSPLNINSTDHYEEKSQIAMKAAELCQPGDSAVINCGSTAFLLGQQLCGKGVQIVTNYFPLASYLIEEEHEDVVLIGGQYNRTQGIFLNPALSTLMGYAGNWMFTSGKGLTETGLYKTDMLTAVAEQQMLDRIDKLVVVVDSSKVGSRTGMLFCPAEKIDYLITGKNADPKIIKAIEAQGTQVILV